MSQPVYYVDEEDIVEEAVKKMKEAGTKKILVKSKGKPVAVLESWKITPNDLKLKVKQIKPLGKIEVVPQGTDADAAINALSSASAVYVSERNNPNEIIGVVTAYDVSKAF
jgi:CBS domain-containing protein